MVDVKVKSTERVARCDGVGICCMIALLIRALPRDPHVTTYRRRVGWVDYKNVIANSVPRDDKTTLRRL